MLDSKPSDWKYEPKKPITADANQLADELYTEVDTIIGSIDIDVFNRRKELEEVFQSIATLLNTLEGEQDE